ncbi:MAG: hydantoinase/oxoprolinase family protein, partial [Chloroflexota bacterium]|nr:hydantoinase/oxoprolinase family protein [Chloroflexota bacterium]
ELEAEGRAWLDEEGVPQEAHIVSRSADLRYVHQGSEVTVLLDGVVATSQTLDALIQEFHAQHQLLYGFALDQPVEIVTLRVTVSGDVGFVALPKKPGGTDFPEKAILDRRQVYFDESDGFVPCNIYRRDQLAPGASISGPAILEGMDSTVLINPGWAALVDDYGNCIIRPD